MHTSDKRTGFRTNHSSITGSASSSRARVSSVVEPKSRVPNAAIAAGAISVAVLAGAVLRSGYGDGGGQGIMASLSSETAGAIIQPTIDHDSLAYQEAPLSLPVDLLPADRATPVPQARKSQSPRGSSLAQGAGARPLGGGGGGSDPSASSPATSSVDTDPGGMPVALEDASLGSAATRIEEVTAAAYDTSKGWEEQSARRFEGRSASRSSDPVMGYTAARESYQGISGAAARPSLVTTHEDGLPDGTAIAPNVAAPSPQILEEVESQAVVSADPSDILGIGDFETDRVVEAPVTEAGPLDQTPLLDTEQLDAPAPRTRTPAETNAMALLKTGEPAAAAQPTGYSASSDEGSRTPLFGRLVHSDDQSSSGEPIEVQHDPAVPAVTSQAVDRSALAIKPSAAAGLDASLADSATGSPANSLRADTDRVTLVTGSDSAPLGLLPLRISSGSLVSVRLADLISLFEDRLDRPLFVWLKSSTSAQEFVTFESLRSAGIDVQFDPEGRQVTLAISDARAP